MRIHGTRQKQTRKQTWRRRRRRRRRRRAQQPARAITLNKKQQTPQPTRIVLGFAQEIVRELQATAPGDRRTTGAGDLVFSQGTTPGAVGAGMCDCTSNGLTCFDYASTAWRVCGSCEYQNGPCTTHFFYAPSVCSRHKALPRASVRGTSLRFGRRGKNSWIGSMGKNVLRQPVSQMTCERIGTTRRLSKQDLVPPLS